MTAIKSFFILVVACLLVCFNHGQTLTYSAGWVNGKRSAPAWSAPAAWSDILGAGNHGDPHLFPANGPVPISDTSLGKNYLCFVVNSQLTDNNFRLKSAEYPGMRSRPSK